MEISAHWQEREAVVSEMLRRAYKSRTPAFQLLSVEKIRIVGGGPSAAVEDCVERLGAEDLFIMKSDETHCERCGEAMIR